MQQQRLIGAHMSIAGGYYKAVERASDLEMTTCQIFTKNNNQWRAKPITEEEIQRFRQTLTDKRITHPLSHSSYLINLAAAQDDLWKKSIDGFVIELQRAGQLQIDYVVVHPGAYTTSSEEAGLRRIVQALDEVHRQTNGRDAMCLLEITAGQGTCLGHRFEHLGWILEHVQQPERLGICFDTCHAFAAGYPLGTPDEYEQTIHELEKIVSLDRIKAFHLNDSKRPLGSRVDRHEHIGQGHLGLEPFRLLLNDPRFAQIPMYLETPKGKCGDTDWDAINMQTLRELTSAP